VNFYLHKPAANSINTLLSSQTYADFTYQMVGHTADKNAHNQPIRGYKLDHNRVQLGQGQACFERAKAAIRQWQMFDLGWVQIVDSNAQIEVGTLAGVIAKSFGFWSVNVCRIVYTLDESAAEMTRFGFGYGTLPAHIERGEERFSVEHHHTDDTVWYDILAFSRPNRLIAKFGYPFTRQFQKRFARDSKRAMVQVIKEEKLIVNNGALL